MMVDGEGEVFYNYILYNDVSNATYNGYTVDIERRLRQHNGEIKGGAGGTAKHRGHWKFLAVVTSPQFTKNTAMSFEWWVRYPTGKKPRPAGFAGPLGRLRGLEMVMASDKFKGHEFEVVVMADEIWDRL
jgi:predicted GIY-YIG superfamily endonuclease